MLKCIQEANTNKFLQKCMEERLAKQNEDTKLIREVQEQNRNRANREGEAARDKRAGAKPEMTEQEKFESDMLDLKLAIQQTEELIELSKVKKINQDGVGSPDPDRTRFNPIKERFKEASPRADVIEGEQIQTKWSLLIEEKEQEINELLIVRHAQQENINRLTQQFEGSQREIVKLQDQVAKMERANVEQEQLAHLQNDNIYLKNQNQRLQKEAADLHRKMGDLQVELRESSAAAVRSHQQQFQNL